MSKTLHLTLLGSPHIRLDDQLLTEFATTKAQALLFYLAVTAHSAAQRAPHSRDSLAALLWGEMTDTQAKQNLRAVLPDLRRLVGDHLRIERQTVAFDHSSPHWLDVAVLRRGLAPGQTPADLATRQAAVDLYQGEFLSGFYVHNAPAFEIWALEQREQLHVLAVEALFTLVREYMQREAYASALAANRRLLFLEPWSEPAHRQQMLLLDQTGERGAALAQYETCRRILLAEFDVEPLPETTTLYERIRTRSSAQRERGTEPTLAPERTQAGADGPAGDQRPTHPASAAGTAEEKDLPAQVVSYNLPRPIELYGRQAELASLHTWVLDEGCRLVGIFGIGGQGKTALAVAFAHAMAEAGQAQRPADEREAGFGHILWRSLINAPPLAEVMQEWLAVLAGQAATTLPVGIDQQLSLLLEHLRRQRCLLILDNLESILQSDARGGYRPGYEGYGELLRRVAEKQHRGCLLLTSRERPQDLIRLHEDTAQLRLLSLAGLPAGAGRQMLRARGLAGEVADLGELVRHYSGNPLGLKLVAETVQSVFAGDIGAFLQAETLVFDDIRAVLDQQFERLPPLEREVMLWLAIVREPVPFAVLRDLLGQPPASRALLEAVRSLLRRSLLEREEASLGLQNVVLEYCSAMLTETIGRELSAGFGDNLATPIATSFLNRFALLLAQSKEYVRASQTRLLLQPVAERLVQTFGSAGAARRLQQLLAGLRATAPVSGYAAANLLHLLLHLGAEVRGSNFSQLYLRQLYLRGISLPQTNFTQAEIVDSVFSEPFGIVYAAVFSPDGHYLAAGMSEGAIYIWRTADQQLVQIVQAHKQAVKELAFAQHTTTAGERHLVLASASDDRRVGLWLLTEQGQVRWHTYLSHMQQEGVIAVGLRPDGQRVTSVDIDGHVFVWDVSTRAEAQLVHHFATAFTRFRLIAFSEDAQTVVIGQRDGKVQLWQATSGEAGQLLTDTTGLIFALALRRDGRLLVTGGREGRLSLWMLPAGQPHQIIETQAGAIHVLAFSPDGSYLTSAHEDLSIRLWIVDAQGYLRLHATLLGHTQRNWSVAFGPQSKPGGAGDRIAARQLLVSTSSDYTIRVWDTETGQTLYMLRGEPRVLAAHAMRRLPEMPPADGPIIDPPTEQESGWLLAAAGYSQLVYVWQGRGVHAERTPRILSGARGPLYSVAISPDSHTVAAGGYDRTIYLWDIASGHLRQTFHGHTQRVYSVVFHPDGRLLASGSGDGTIRLWRLEDGRHGKERAVEGASFEQPVAVLPADHDVVHDVTFSPDGRLLARGGTDRVLRLWDMTQSHYPELVEANGMGQDASEEDILAVAFSPDGSKVAYSGNHLIQLWNLRNGESPLILRQHTSWIYSVAFSPDGTTLASSSADCTICLWDVASGALRSILRGHTETVYKVVFTPDGSAVVSSSFDGTIKFWDGQTGEWFNTVRVEGPYAGMNISGVTGITEAQREALKALGAVEL
jgi:WD40 repeat protein/DNA-binding SARP family transcriptional activator